jgi:hypothetical protein
MHLTYIVALFSSEAYAEICLLTFYQEDELLNDDNSVKVSVR